MRFFRRAHLPAVIAPQRSVWEAGQGRRQNHLVIWEHPGQCYRAPDRLRSNDGLSSPDDKRASVKVAQLLVSTKDCISATARCRLHNHFYRLANERIANL